MTILRTNTIAGVGTTTFGPTLDGKLEFNSQNYVVLPKGTSTQEGVLRTTVDVVGTGGTYYDNLVLAMTFNEANGLRDVSSRNRNPGAYGNVAISTAQSKYYGSSAYFDGSGDYLGLPISGDFVHGTGDLTIETWIYKTSSTNQMVYDTRDYPSYGNPSISFEISSSQALQFYAGNYSSSTPVIQGGTIPLNTWTHLVFSRSSGTNRLFIDGVQVASNSNVWNQSGTPLQNSIGYSNFPGVERYFNGYIQDLRIYKGLAKYTANFTPPERIAELGVGFKAGQLRYNTDSNKVELYDGSQWTEVQASRPDLNGGARGVFGGGFVSPARINNIEYITISSTGNSTDFGDLTVPRYGCKWCASSTRGLAGGGNEAPGAHNTIDYITIASTGTVTDFGDRTVSGTELAGALSSSTRGVFAGGSATNNTIDYVTIASTGDAKDFGDLTVARGHSNGCSSSTRGLFFGGEVPAPTNFTNVIDCITISTLGTVYDFGDISSARRGLASCSNSTRGLAAGGDGPTNVNNIEYVTMTTLGNTTDFGDLTAARGQSFAGMSNPTRGVFGDSVPSGNTMDYVTIATQGNAVDFGDALVASGNRGGTSNAHGGL